MRTGSFGRTAINVKLEKVTNDIADIKKGKPMTFAEADTGNVNPHYMSRLMSWFDDNLENNKYYSIEFYWKDFTPDGHIMMIAKHNGALMIYDPQNNLKLFGKDIERFLYTTRLGTIKIMNLSDCFLNKSVVDFVLEERK